MKPSDIFAFAKHETAQVFVLVFAALWFMSSKGVDPDVIRYTAWAGIAYIIGEKLRSSVVALRKKE